MRVLGPVGSANIPVGALAVYRHAVTVTLRIRQYVYLAVCSRSIPATEMVRRIGLAADQTTVRGSKVGGERPVPRDHAWRVLNDDPGVQVGEQLECLVKRLLPYREAIAGLAAELRSVEGDTAGAALNVVRYFDDPEGEPEDKLLGWHLSAGVLQFAAEVGAEIDIDEYGLGND